jgi:hypothetical protein
LSPPTERNRVIPLVATLTRGVHDWALGKAARGDVIALERLGAVVGADLVEEILEYARDVAHARDTDPGDEGPPGAA